VTGRSLLLIGGSGFFGKSFLDAFRRGLLKPWSIDHIIVVARGASNLRHDHPPLIKHGVSLVDADVGRAESLPSADIILHAASTTDARRYAECPQEERSNILSAVDNYARIAERLHRGRRIVFASTGAVYGQQPSDLAELPEDHALGDTHKLIKHKRDYAEAKRMSEERIAALGASGANTAVARCFAFLGFYLPRDQHFAIGNFFADGLAGRPVRVHARKAVYRSYMHTDDLVRWLMTIAEAASPDCPIYNVGSDEALTVGEVAALVARRFAVPAEIPPITDAAIDRYVPSIAHAQAELGLRLSFNTETAIDDVASRLETELGL
jgi:dTDP-glucose 4,6-dehydratase